MIMRGDSIRGCPFFIAISSKLFFITVFQHLDITPSHRRGNTIQYRGTGNSIQTVSLGFTNDELTKTKDLTNQNPDHPQYKIEIYPLLSYTVITTNHSF